jgi:CheY-like chemotaxis protein
MSPVILIDDDVDDQELMLEICKDLRPSFPVLQFENGLQGLSYLQTTVDKPRIIFCDLNMPRMNGVELLRIIQSTPYLRRKSIPFICLSTANAQAIVVEAYELGVQGFFQKPASMDEFRKIFQWTFDFWDHCIHPRQTLI